MAIVPAALLADGPVRIENVPKIIDVTLQMEIMRELGAQIRLINSTTVEIQNTQNPSLKPHELERKLRASYYLLGVLLGKYGFAEVAMPGGCNFGGVRPIDQHIKGFEALGAKVTLPKGRLHPGRGARGRPARRTYLFRRCHRRRDHEHHARSGSGQGSDDYGELRKGAAYRRSGELPECAGRRCQGRRART